MRDCNDYEKFKRLFKMFGNKTFKVENGSYSIYEIDENIYDACFLNNAGYGDSFQDPSLIIEVDNSKKEVRVNEYFNDFANAVIQIQRTEETEEDLDEHLNLFLEKFEVAVRNLNN
jgi:hypothetical protein